MFPFLRLIAFPKKKDPNQPNYLPIAYGKCGVGNKLYET